MLKFVKHHLSSIEGMDILASIALVLFVTIFLYISYYALFVMKKDLADEISDLPLQDDDMKINI